jgi:hypothetical protein
MLAAGASVSRTVNPRADVRLLGTSPAQPPQAAPSTFIRGSQDPLAPLRTAARLSWARIHWGATGPGLKGRYPVSALETLLAASPALVWLVAAVALAYVLLLAVAALVAILHPDRERRIDARRVLTSLLVVVAARRRR